MSAKKAGTSGCVIPAGRVLQNAVPVQISVPRDADSGTSDVRLERDGELVRAIEVICSCGEVIRLICDYESLPEGPSRASFESLNTSGGLGQVGGVPTQ